MTAAAVPSSEEWARLPMTPLNRSLATMEPVAATIVAGLDQMIPVLPPIESLRVETGEMVVIAE